MFGCTQRGQGLVLAMTCVMEGISPMRVNQTYHIIEGRLSMRADAMLARYVERGGKYTIIERSATRAAAVFEKDTNRIETEYTLDEAQRQGLPYRKDGKTLKENWTRYPKQMLWARLVSDTVRALDPGVCAGTYTPEELQDAPVEIPPITAFDISSDGETSKADAPIKATRTKTETPKVVEPEPAQKLESEPKQKVVEQEQKNAEVDYSRMPVGRLAGKQWTEFTTEQLLKIFEVQHPGITDEHKDAVQAELARRAK